jgi:anti-anti-sigma factor
MEMSTHTDNGSLVITLRGKFTFADNPLFREVLDRIGRPESQRVVFQMQNVEFIDSAALGMLLLAHEEAKRREKDVCIANANGHVKRILDMARFDQFFLFT